MADAASIWRLLESYAAAGDPLSSASNRLALILASNQPFYPFYVWWVTGVGDTSLALTLISTPFFLAAPWVTKRFPGKGRLYFPGVGAINTFFSAYVFGQASGVELFLAPCIIVAALSCRAAERAALGVFLAALLGAFAFLHGRYGAPLFVLGPAQYEALLSLNAYSAATLSVVAAWIFSGAWCADPAAPSRSDPLRRQVARQG